MPKAKQYYQVQQLNKKYSLPIWENHLKWPKAGYRTFDLAHDYIRQLQKMLPHETFRIRAFTEFTVKTYKPLRRRNAT